MKVKDKASGEVYNAFEIKLNYLVRVEDPSIGYFKIMHGNYIIIPEATKLPDNTGNFTGQIIPAEDLVKYEILP